MTYLARSERHDRFVIRLGQPAGSSQVRRNFAAVAARPVPPFSCARVLEHGVHNGLPYLVSEYVDGLSVAQLVDEEGCFQPAALHALAIGSMAALTGLHDTGQAHGNLKPTTVLVTLGGIRLVDAGLAGTPGKDGAVKDLHQWAALMAYAGTGGSGRTELAEPLNTVVSAAATAGPDDAPTSRELMIMLTRATPAARPAALTRSRRRLGYLAAVGSAAAVIALALSMAGGPGPAREDSVVPPLTITVPTPGSPGPTFGPTTAGQTEPSTAPVEAAGGDQPTTGAGRLDVNQESRAPNRPPRAAPAVPPSGALPAPDPVPVPAPVPIPLPSPSAAGAAPSPSGPNLVPASPAPPPAGSDPQPGADGLLGGVLGPILGLLD